MERKKKALEGKKKSLLLITFSRLKEDKLAVLGMFIFLIMILAALLAPIIAPYSYKEQDLQNVLASPSVQHFFGTDSLGRDIFSRAMQFDSRREMTEIMLEEHEEELVGKLLRNQILFGLSNDS